MVSKVVHPFFLVVFVLLASSCAQKPAAPTIVASPLSTPGQLQTNTPASQATLTPTLALTPTPDEQVVVNEDYGFRFTLPPGHKTTVNQASGEVLLFMGIKRKLDNTSGYALPPIGLRVFAKPESTDLASWFSERQGDCYEYGGQPPAGVPFIDPIVESQADFKGYNALRYESGCWPVPYEMLVDRDSLAFSLYYLRDYPIDYEADFNQILASLEFFEPALQTIETPSPVAPTPTPTVCIDEAAQPIAAPPRQTPVEVRFISAGNLWVWNEDEGKAQQISKTGDAQSFSFSPDGQIIAFTRGKPYSQTELWSVHRDGSDLRLLLSADQLHAMVGEPTTTEFIYFDSVSYIDWIDGTHTLGFEVLRNYDAIGGCCESGGTWQIDTETGNLSAWTLPPDISMEREGGLVSPDGKQIALVGETGLTLVNADGSNRRENVLIYPYVPLMEGGGFVPPNILWAPDSQSLTAITYPENMWDEDFFTTWFVPVDGTPAQKLSEISGYAFSASPSPDQRYLAYRKPPDPMSNHWELHLATFDGTQDLIYAQGHLMDFWGWSPDGVHFVFGQDSTRMPSLGSVCGGSQPLMDPLVFPLWHLTWIDPQRFVFIAGGDGPSEGELWLGTVGGDSVLIGAYRGDYAFYDIKPDQ